MKIIRALRKPLLFDEVDESFWREPYVSEQILEAHLDPATDDASRRTHTISKSTHWIAGLTSPRARLLDLGCGPGLYCEGFHRFGLQVTGLDYSSTAIGFARQKAERLKQRIRYEVADYRRGALPGPADLVTLIYGGFCCITNEERDDLLLRVKSVLSPTGLFVFDVFTREYIEEGRGSVYVKLKDGFWRPGVHLVVELKHEYPEADAHLDRYVVMDLEHGLRVYNLWKHYYTRETLSEVLERAGFEAVGWYGDLTGNPFHPRGPWIGVVARAR